MNKEKAKTVALWAVRALLTLVFLAAALPKLTGNPGMVEHFKQWGYPDRFYLFIGAVELFGAIGLLIPKLTGYAALLLCGNMVGATLTHLLHHEPERAAFTVFLVILLGIVAYANRPAFLRKSSG